MSELILVTRVVSDLKTRVVSDLNGAVNKLTVECGETILFVSFEH